MILVCFHFSISSVVTDSGINQHKFLTTDVEKLSFNWLCKCILVLFSCIAITSLPVKSHCRQGSFKFICILVKIFFPY